MKGVHYGELSKGSSLIEHLANVTVTYDGIRDCESNITYFQSVCPIVVLQTKPKCQEIYVLMAPVPRKFLGIGGQDRSDSKSSWLHVDIFQILLYSFEVYSIDPSKMIGNSPEVSNFNQ